MRGHDSLASVVGRAGLLVALAVLAWPTGGQGVAGADVTIGGFAFGPVEIRVQAGETVRWINGDPVAHTVTSDDGAFDSGLVRPGASYERRFDEPGIFPYHCTPHPFMTGRVVVAREAS